MLKTAYKTSFLIESQLPDFINEEYELFSKFIQKYYEQLEIQGQPLDIVHNLQTYRDIDFYEKNILKQSTTLTGALSDVETTITVDDATSFPKNGGYIKIDDEICFYKERTDTSFLEVSRGVSGNTSLGDLYEESVFVTTQSTTHLNGSTVQNISNLFLYALVKSFEKQYLNDFPEAYLKGEIDKRTLIKHINSFYQSKGTDNSIKFLFKCLVKDDPEPTVAYPRDFTLKSSESQWINNYSLKVKILSGNPTDLIGKKIEQSGDVYASAIVDNVRYAGTFGTEELYEIILSEQSVNGNFTIASKTKLTKEVLASTTDGDRVDVFSTQGWGKTGKFNIGSEVFEYNDKNVNQFVISNRSGTFLYPIGTNVTYAPSVSSDNVTLLVYGVFYGLENNVEIPYSNPGDTIDISEPGFITDDIKIFDEQNNLRWITSTGTAAIADINPNVSAIFEDGEGYYIASSGFPSHAIGTLPADAKDQKNLKIIRKNPISTTETYKTQYRDVGIALNGIPFLGYKDEEVVLGGPIETITINTRGTGYKSAPFVLINGVPNLARTKLAGQVVESVIIDVPGDYDANPTVEILSGRNAVISPVITNGEITSLTIDNAGEYYSSPPTVRITDSLGKGRFANYTAEVSNTGQITGFIKNNGGSLYTQGNVLVEILPAGSGATATSTIKEWRKDRYYKNSSILDADNGGFFHNYIPSKGKGYAYYACPTSIRPNDNGTSHSPIIGFAYDGNPIYGPYGYHNPMGGTNVQSMTSSYSINMNRTGGPSEATYPLGVFIDDYTYLSGSGSLDENNGRFCVTPEYPEGTYAYFCTTEFPYIIGENYYSLPVDSNYNSEISQDDIPVNAKRLRTDVLDRNGDLTTAVIEDIRRGTVSSADVISSGSNFSVGCKLEIDNSDTSGSGAGGEVDSVKGKTVESIESQSTKALYFELSNTAYFFDGDTITQEVTGAQGELVGNVFSGTKFALRNITGTFNSTDVLSSSRKVLSLILDKNASYTKGAVLVLEDGVNDPIAKGIVLESTSEQNTVKIEVTESGFIVSDNLFLSSANLLDTTGSKVLSINSLSENRTIFKKQDNVALLKTTEPHGVGVGEIIDIDINPDDSTTTKTYNVRTRIYQEAVLEIPVISRVLSDTGIGRIEILNSGDQYTDNVYDDVALSGGTGSGAKAKITVENKLVTKVEITDKGTGYSKFDLLTVGDTDLSKGDTIEPRLKVRVDHIGFSIQNSKLNLDSSLDIKINDKLVIGDEIVTVDAITGNTVVVMRGSDKKDHFDGAVVTVYDPGYTLSTGFVINTVGVGDDNNPIINSYDPNTQKVEFVYDVNQSLASIDEVTLTTTFFDESTPSNRLVKVVSVSDPKVCFEIDLGDGFKRNPVIDIKKYYKYNFDVSGLSTNVLFDVSPSINNNLVTPEFSDNHLKLGFGPRLINKVDNIKEEVNYTRYYYFDSRGYSSSESGYFNIVDDPLQGSKVVLYSTPTEILYSTDTKATDDGTGSMSYTTKSAFSVGAINTVKITNIGIDYQKIPVVTGVYDNDGVLDTTVDCFLNSTDIGVPRNIRIFNNGGAYHNDKTIQSNFRSNYILTVSNFIEDAFGVGETVIQKTGSIETARARVTSWRKGSNILIVDRVTGIFRKDKEIIGLARNHSATLDNISFTEFKPDIRTYSDNMGYYKSDYGKVSDGNQKILDSYYYQDYSYLVKSKTPIDIWRSLIKETTHPAGFQLFGEVLLESSAEISMPGTTNTSRISILEVSAQISSIQNTYRQIEQRITLADTLNIERGVGSVALDTASTSEVSAGDVFLTPSFNGALTDKGNLEGRTEFNLVDKWGKVVKPYNDQALIITLDGILQEPGVAYTISNDKITFAQPPLGERVVNNQTIPGVSFYGKRFEFTSNELNARYLKKIRNIFQRNGRWTDAANQLEFNKSFIQTETLGYIKNKYPVLSWGALQSKCRRDIGLIVDALAHDLRFGGNESIIIAAEKFFTSGVLTSLTGDGIAVDPNDPTGDRISELEAALEAFEYATRLCKLAMKNWDVILKGVSWTPGTNVVKVGSTKEIALGMRISAGRAFPEGATVIEIVDNETIKIGKKVSDDVLEEINSLPLSSTTVLTINENTILDGDVDTTNSIIQVGENFYLQIGLNYYYATTPVDNILPSDNAQMIFSFSPLNNGTYFDASLLLEKNKASMIASTISAVDAKYPDHTSTGYTSKCERDLGYLIDSINYCLRYGGNKKVIEFAQSFYVGHKLTHVQGELVEVLFAHNHLRDLMIKAMRNEGEVVDQTVRGDTVTPVCAQVEASITTYIDIIENILEGGINRVKVEPQNESGTGFWSNIKTYTDINTFNDAKLLDGTLEECEDVAAALETLYDVLKVTMTTGPGTITVSKPDYIDGQNTEFDLYYTDGTEVDTDPNENLFVALSGVLQHTTSYEIDRTVVPNKIVFDTAPIWAQSDNTKTLYEALAVDKFFAHGMGNYIRCTIDTSGITNGSAGPFLILDSTKESKPITSPKFALVFIDGVLQRENTSYTITGPAIRFTRNIYRDNNVEIIVLYGRDVDSSIKLYDFEEGQYFNEIILTCDAGSTNNFAAWKTWYGLSYDDHQVAYQKIGGEKRFIGNVKKYTTTDQQLIITIAGNNPDIDSSNIFFSGLNNFFGAEDYNDEYELTGTTNTISVVKNEYNDYRMQRNTGRWLYGTKRADEAFYERKRGGANLNAGDLIRIDGEETFRTVNELPQYVHPKTYNNGEEVSNSFFGSCSTTDYIGDRRGEGLSITCTVSAGKVVSIDWNKVATKNYDTAPIIHFIPVDQKGGGARAECVVVGGEVVDIVITNPGSGYTKAPTVYAARQYDVIKGSRKIDSLINIKFENSEVVPWLNVISDITPIKGIESGGPPSGPIWPPGQPYDPFDYPPLELEMSTTIPDDNIQITSFIVSKIDIPSLFSFSPESVFSLPASVDSVSMPDISHTSQGMSIIETKFDSPMFIPYVWVTAEGNIITVPSPPPGGDPPPGLPPGNPGNPNEQVYTYQMGFVDHRRYTTAPALENMTMRPTFFQWEGAKFMSTGDITSPAGNSVSEYTIEEFDRYGFNIGQFESNAQSGWADDGYSFNIAYPTINNYLSQIEVDDLPDTTSGSFVANGGVVYANTRLFPPSGVISLGKEKIYYTNKLIDRFLGCTRGYDGTIIEAHPIGRYIRNA